jgi:hypothetical protein
VSIAQHSSLTDEHFTPPMVIDAVRSVMCGIDLDPASSPKANKIVGANRIYTRADDGLVQRWQGRIFLNPPGGSLVLRKRRAEGLGTEAAKKEAKRLAGESSLWHTKSRATAWWRKLTHEYETGAVTEAVFVGFTLELLRNTQSGSTYFKHPFDYTICVPRDRLKFGGDQPTHANVIVYMGPHPERFIGEFESFGRCK